MTSESAQGRATRVAHGPAIRAMRELVGASVSALAPRCGMSQSYLSRIELGDKQPSPTAMRAIADALGVSLDAITYVVHDCDHLAGAA